MILFGQYNNMINSTLTREEFDNELTKIFQDIKNILSDKKILILSHQYR